MEISVPAPQTLLETEKQSSFIGLLYTQLKLEEAKPPDPAEEIKIGKRIFEHDPEYEALTRHGVPTADLIRGRPIRRDLLLKAGFVFDNYPLPYIEKPLINAEINGVNYGQRKLLTAQELSLILAHQRANPDLYGTAAIAEDSFREEMLSLLVAHELTIPQEIQVKVNLYRDCIKQLESPHPTTKPRETDQAFAKLLWLHHAEMWKEGGIRKEEEFIESNLGDILTWTEPDIFARFPLTVRNKRAQLIASRKTALAHTPSPFLDSGFHFPDQIGNPDYTVVGSNGKLFRVNMMVLHLLSRGLSEMGDGEKGDGEQDYSIGNYIRDLALETDDERQKTKSSEEAMVQTLFHFDRGDLTRKVQERLKLVVSVWAASPDAPQAAQRLLGKIRNIESSGGKSAIAIKLLDLLNRFKELARR